MARAGILYSHVAQAAAQLVADDKNPTVDNVREALGGTGSKSTIAPFLKRWKAEHQDAVVGSELGLPADLLQAVKGVYDKLQADVQQQLVQAREEHLSELQGVADQAAQGEAANRFLTATNATLSDELAQTKNMLAQLQTAHHAQTVALATAQADNAGLQQRLADRAAEVAALNQQLTQARGQFEHYQEATAAQREQERQASEQRIARLEQDLAGANRQVAAQQLTIGQQETQLVRITTDHATLQQVLRATQDNLGTTRVERERLSVQLEEKTLARQSLASQLDATQTLLTEAKMALAAREQETGMLTENLRRAEERIDKFAEEKLAWLQERSAIDHQLRQAANPPAVTGG